VFLGAMPCSRRTAIVLLTSEVAQRFFAEVNERAKPFLSDDHFTVDGTLIQAWASHKSFRLEGQLGR